VLLSRFLDIDAEKHNRFGLVFDYAKRPAFDNTNAPRRENIHATTTRHVENCRYCKKQHTNW
jgi:hypothetical protein